MKYLSNCANDFHYHLTLYAGLAGGEGIAHLALQIHYSGQVGHEECDCVVRSLSSGVEQIIIVS